MLDTLTPVNRAALLALRIRALDARSATPILGDEKAAELAATLDLPRDGIMRSMVLVHALRALTLDRAVRAFVARHPDAVVLDLGAGLDTRAARCAPPATVDWLDVDLPEIAALRTRLLPGSRAVAADLTGDAWLAEVPAGRPTIAVADGLMAFLPGAAFRALWCAITAHAPRGEVVFNAYTPFALKAGIRGPEPLPVPTGAEGFTDAHTPESWGAQLTLVEEQLQAHAPEVAGWPQPERAMAWLSARIGPLARATDRVVRYSF